MIYVDSVESPFWKSLEDALLFHRLHKSEIFAYYGNFAAVTNDVNAHAVSDKVQNTGFVPVTL